MNADLRWSLQLAGTPHAQAPEGRVFALADRDAALLAWLALEGPSQRSRLAALLWPGADAASARNSLRQRLFKLRRQLGAELIVGQEVLSLASGLAHDLHESDQVLADLPLSIGGEFAAWLEQQQSRRRSRMREALEQLADMAERARDWRDALSHAAELLALEPLSEATHRRVMRLHYLAGDRAAALLAFDRCERVLKDEVGTGPSPETLALLRLLEAGGAAAPALAAVPLAAVLRPPRLIGRDAELAALQRAWAERRTVLVLGEAGMGKTRLCTDFAASREPAPGAVLLAGARPGDERVPYASFSRLLRALPAAVWPALPEAQRRELARLLPELGAPPPGDAAADASPTRLLNAASALFEHPRVADQVIFFDDLHFADDASVELLHLVAGGGARRWLIGARGAEITASGRALLEGFEQRGDSLRLALPPLSADEVGELLASLDLPEPERPALAERLWRRSGGNPLYLLETLKAWMAQGGPAGATDDLPTAPNVAALVERRISRLSVAAVQLARCAAIAAPDFDIHLAAAVLGLRTLELADPWAELEAAQVLHDGAFVHDLLYEAARASVPRPLAQRLHGEIAAYLEAHGGAPGRVAAHWLEAGDEGAALASLQAASDAAGQALRRREQAEILHRVADIAERLGRRGQAFEALLAAEQAWTVADRTQADPELGERLLRLADTPARHLRALLAQAEIAVNAGRYVEARQLGEAAATLARQLGEPTSEVEALRCAAASASHAGDSQAAVRLLRPVLPWVAAHAPPFLQQGYFNDLACCLGNVDQYEEARVYYRKAMDLALALGRLDEASVCAANLTAELKSAGDYDQALAQLQLARRYALACDAAQGIGWQQDLMSFALLRDMGRFADALQGAEPLLHAMTQHAGAIAVAHAHLGCLWVHLGQFARAKQALAEAGRGNVAPARRARLAQLEGRLQRAQGRSAEAAFGEAVQLAPLTGRTVMQSMIELDHALGLPADEALAVALRVQQRAQGLGLLGVALAAGLRACRFAREAGQLALAATQARQVLAAPGHLRPDDLYQGELWLNAAHALQAAGAVDDARAAVQQGRAWVQDTATQQVPPAFRESFLHRNPVNRELLSLPG